MKYSMILKYTYSYTSSGNNYKEAVWEYYQLFDEKQKSTMFSLGSVPTDKAVTVERFSENQIEFSYMYSIYSKPHTFAKTTEVVTERATLKRGEAVEIKCVDTYWRYASGGENSPATLRVEWIEYQQFWDECWVAAKQDKYKAADFARFLIKEGNFQSAFDLLVDAGRDCYELGLCYEKGYGTFVDINKALNIYLSVDDIACNRGIERIYNLLENTNKKMDKIKKTVLLEKMGRYKDAYYYATIPTEQGDNSLQDMRRNVELNITLFLTLGRPHNDPFGNPTHNVHHLAEYYDMLNGVAPQNKKVYWKTWEEDDHYDGGTITKERFYVEDMLETIRKEAEKGDPLAIAVLIIQHYEKTEDHASLADSLLKVAQNGNGLAYYLLGLYHYNIAKTAKKQFEHDYLDGLTYNYQGADIEADIKLYMKQNAIKFYSLMELASTLKWEYNKIKRRLAEGENVSEMLEQLTNYLYYVATKNRQVNEPIYQQNDAKATEYFAQALKLGFHLAIAPLAPRIVENDPSGALAVLEEHEPYVPYIRDTFTAEYYALLKQLRSK